MCALISGSMVGSYRVEELVSTDSRGAVYRARHPQLQREVSIRILSPTLAVDSRWSSSFEDAAHRLAQLDHPHIPRVYEVGEHDNLPYVTTELPSGVPLPTLIHEQRPMALAVAFSVLRPLAQALDAAHASGIVHGDVQSTNILLRRLGGLTGPPLPGRVGDVVLIGFQLIDGAAEAYAECDSKVAGPHLSRTSGFLDSSRLGEADRYALSVVAAEMLTVRTPFVDTESIARQASRPRH